MRVFSLIFIGVQIALGVWLYEIGFEPAGIYTLALAAIDTRDWAKR